MLKNYQKMLAHGYEVLNKVYFGSALPPVVITIMSSPRTNGHFTVNKKWKVGKENFNEINISAEHLDRPVAELMATLLHEMTHYYCQLNGIRDTCQNGRYHNKKFKIQAEKRGVKISQGKYIGWSVTEPTPEFVQVLKDNKIKKPIEMNREMMGIFGKNSEKPRCSTRKYVCFGCGNSLRATKDLNIMCMDCNKQLVKVEK